jgi:hypothetical protein
VNHSGVPELSARDSQDKPARVQASDLVPKQLVDWEADPPLVITRET